LDNGRGFVFLLRELGIESKIGKADKSMFLNLSQLSIELVFTDDFRIKLKTLQNLQNERNKTILSFFNFTFDQIGGHGLGYFLHSLVSTSQVAAHIHLEPHVTYEDDGNLRRNDD
jgi:hypothetical protein